MFFSYSLKMNVRNIAGTDRGVYQLEGGGWKEKIKREWIRSKYFIPMYEYRTMKPVEIVLRTEKGWWREIEGHEFDLDILYVWVEVSQWNPFVQLVYT
jgi:hypothetical protein